MLVAIVAAAAAASVRDGPIPPNPVTLELYHVNQANYTGITNMNTADAAGDAFFDLRKLADYYMCNINKSAPVSPGECANPEEVANDLVITKVEVLASKFAKYGECNVCINGTVPLTRPPQKCVDGTYHCRCSGLFGRDAPCPPAMGRVGVVGLVNMFVDYIHINQTGPSQHWFANLAFRTGGTWYSTVDAGDCDSPTRSSCDWKLTKTIKKVNASCHADAVQARVEHLGSRCFAACPDGGHAVHTTCYITCYYETLLGPQAGAVINGTGGLSTTELVQLWTDAFDNCPPLPSSRDTE